MPSEREVGIGQKRGVDRAKRFDPADTGQIEVIAFGDDLDVVLGLAKGWHAAILENPAGSRVIGRERIDDIAVEGVELCREIACTAMHLQVGAVIVFRVDAEIAGGTGHDLGEAKGADGRACTDGETAFLPDQRL